MPRLVIALLLCLGPALSEAVEVRFQKVAENVYVHVGDVGARTVQNEALSNQGLVMRAIRALASDGLGVLFTTHDPNQALRCADVALLLREGRVLASDPVAEVVTAERLRELYGALVDVSRGRGSLPVFLPSLDIE